MIQWGKFKMPGVIILYVIVIAVTYWAVYELGWLALVLTIPLGVYIATWTDNEHERVQKLKAERKAKDEGQED